MNQILVQNIETFETITRLTVGVELDETVSDRVDQYLTGNDRWGIVSLDDDADGEYMAVLLVAPLSGPDFEMDMTTGEMEPVEDIDPAAELAAKMDIMMEIDNDDEELFSTITVQDNMNDVPQEDILAMLADEPLAPVPAPVENIIDATDEFEAVDIYAERKATITTPEPTISTQPRNKRNTQTKAKGAKMSTQPKKIRNFEILCAFIEATPGVSRTTVFGDAGLQSSLRTPAQVKSIASGDKTEVKRWNRRLNFLIRESKRQGIDIQIERKGRVAHYTIVPASGQLELPFTPEAEARNTAIIGDGSIVIPEGATNIEVVGPDENIIKYDTRRDDEAANQNLSFESLLATLDEDEATITSDDQVAFKAAREMLK